MEIYNTDCLALLGYMIVLNEEMHSYQIRYLNEFLEKENLVDEKKQLVYDVIHDLDEKISYNQAIEAYLNEATENKKKIYSACLHLAMVDAEICDKKNGVDSAELSLLKDMEKTFSSKDKKNITNRAIAGIRKIKKLYDDGNVKKEFDIDLKKVKSIAKEDYAVITEIIATIMGECEFLQQRIGSYEGIRNKALKATIEEFSKLYQKEIFNEISIIKANSFQKELASKSFSIALMGRTKAGKSTLHSVMCDEGEEFIGKGRQRTTRFNRVFTWNGLKIIDTPGIGAGEEEGKKDTEIAYKTISQADIICFVVADDSITEEILHMLDEIATYHKPLIVILNHKDDIYKKSHLKTFMENPYEWINTSGEKNLTGWINRLKRNAEKGGYLDLFNVIPVFLLATIKGKKENNSLFYDASNYKAFIETVEDIISKNSIIYKSQTMLDEPSIQINAVLSRLKKEEKKLTSFRDKVTKIKERTDKEIGFLHREVRIGFENGISTIFDNFRTRYEDRFVEECHNVRDAGELRTVYLGYIDEFKLQDKIEAKVEELFSDYREKANQIVKDLEDEIKYANINIMDSMVDEGSDDLQIPFVNIPIKGVLKVVSMGLDVASIWFPVLALISIPLSFISGLFKSQAQKNDERKKLAMDNFSMMAKGQEKRYTDSIKKEVFKILGEDEGKIDEFLNSILNQVNDILAYIEECKNNISDNLRLLNMKYAIRILEFVSCSERTPVFEIENDIIANRNYDNHVFDIRTRKNDQYDVKKIRKIAGEKISIRVYK